MVRRYFPILFFALTAALVASAVAQERQPSVKSSAAASEINSKAKAVASPTTHSTPAKATQGSESDASDRLEGEKRFRTNCGRCHMPPHKFAPRVMATAIRHMRVRAMITDEDMRLILRYMTE